MRHDVHYTPFTNSPLSPSPPPIPATNNSMLLSVFLALFLPCAGMSAVFIVYIFLLWYSSSNTQVEIPEKPVVKNGLSDAELEKLPKITGKELVMGNECAVCLDEIENEDLARVVPGCNHGFHLECADTWLSRSSACPVCRAKIDAQFLSSYCNENENLC